MFHTVKMVFVPKDCGGKEKLHVDRLTKVTLTCSLREPGGPCTKPMEVAESRMERVNKYTPKLL